MKTVLALCASLLLCATANAQGPIPERPELPELVLTPCPGTAGIEVEGPVVQFPRETAECALQRLRALQPLLAYVSLLEERLQLDNERLEIRDRRIALAVEQSDIATANLETALRRAREAEEDRNKWYRRPGFLLTMGGLIVIALEVAAIFIIREVSE